MLNIWVKTFMPHIIIEHNGRHGLDGRTIAKALHKEAQTIEAFPTGGLRVRVFKPSFSLVGDGDRHNGFIYVTVRIGQGRSEAVKTEIGDRLFQVLTDLAAPVFDAAKPLSLGLEIQEIEKDMTWKKNNIHQILKDKHNG